MCKRVLFQIALLVLAVAGIFTGAAEAQLRPSSAVLLPYFEVDLGSSGRTTMFAVGNVLNQPVDIQIEMRTNWGIPIFTLPVKLAAYEVRTFNLRDWVVQGSSPSRAMTTAEKAHMKAALSGQKSPKDQQFYSTAVAPNLAVGSVVIRTQPGQPQGALWGDFLLVDPALKISMGDDLINLDRAAGCQSTQVTPMCTRHALRFVSGKALNLDTQVLVWTDRSGQPSKKPYPESQRVTLDGTVYNEAGKAMNEVHLRLLPLQIVSVNSLNLKEPFGWMDVKTDDPVFIGLHFDTLRADGAALQAYCLPPSLPPPSDTPRIEIEKRTNGEDANTAPGPSIAVGAPVLWEYIVRNTGNSRLTQIQVEDDRGVPVICPQDALNPGESMTCTGRGTAVACQYENLGTVTAKTPSGADISDDDPSHYFGSQNARIDIETAVNGDDADTAPGLQIGLGSPLQWTYVVTNSGDVNLAEIKVTDERGLVLACPKTSLRPGESMTCTASSTAVNGPYSSVGAATAKPPCGPPVNDSDPVHYVGQGDPGLEIEKRTNGQRYTQAPGVNVAMGSPVTWTYIVRNTGQVTLTNVRVTDNKVSAISCPTTTLQAGESMTCTATGTATACQYTNTGTAVGTPPSGPSLTAQDSSFYYGQIHPSIDIDKRTNGQDAPTAPGPEIPVGSPVQWTYLVKNTGDVVLTNVAVTDDRGVAVSCPKNTLQPGESMTCTASGTAIVGQYRNVGTATGTPPCGNAVSDSDASHYYGAGTPGLTIEKRTNGQRYTQAPGASVAAGSTVTWSYIVKNTGNVALTNVRVTDDKVGNISCPRTTLQPGESMTCTASGTATACQYTNTGTAVGTPPSGPNLTAQDWSFYYGQIHPSIDIDKRTNGQDAPTAPGPSITVGSPVQWTYLVKNTGDVVLTNVTVTDDRGVAVSCPKTTLQPNESMTCTGSGTATQGQYRNVGTATGTPPCGNAVSDSDASHYNGSGTPGLTIVKKTNGQRYTQPPGADVNIGSTVNWSYIVTNTGTVTLTNVRVTDNRVSTISCPRTTLQAGESMTCTASGTATACQYSNTGTAVGTPPSGSNVTAQDVSFYYGKPDADISIVKKTNGQDVSQAPGPNIPVGNPVQWTYIVKNTGNVVLTNVAVSDNRGVVVSCPKTTLQPNESMTCTGNGTATAGQYQNIGTATGTPPCGDVVKAQDSSYYYGTGQPGLTIVKKTNGQRYTQPPGADVNIGSTVNWSYIVTNTGTVTLTNVRVTDNRVSTISCPRTTLQAGESMTCTASGTATACQYSNTGTAVGTPPSGSNVTAQDVSFYYGKPDADISIVKKTNGQDVSQAPGPSIPVGSAVQWTYIVKNTGNVVLTNVAVSDNRGVVVSCPKTTLQPNESMTCTGNGTATAGQYQNIGTATGTPPCGDVVKDQDSSYYNGTGQPGLSIVKKTNGQRYTQPPGADVNIGSTVNWSYIVTNTGTVTLTNVRVTDNRVSTISCPRTTLQAGESMTCTASGTATACQYSNTGTAVGTPPSGSNVTAQDVSFYYGKPDADISIVKKTNGQDVSQAPGPNIPVGSPVQWTYIVKNTGNVVLTSVNVTDDRGVAVSCPKTTLQPNESMTCTGSGTATAGQYRNIGTATGTPPCGDVVKAQDSSYYYGTTPPPANQGCTPGYWKNHTGSWTPTSYSTSLKVKTVFDEASAYPSLGNSTLLAALSFQGGSTLEGAAGNLLRAATAALLNAAHPNVSYPRSTSSVISDVDEALDSDNRDVMLDLAKDLDDDNNLGCPLN